MPDNKSGFTGKKLATPQIKNKAKFVKNVSVPKSANYKTDKEGDWGRVTK